MNGTKHVVSSDELNYDDVVKLAGHDPKHVFSVTFRHGGGFKNEGIISKGDIVKITTGTKFAVYDTSSA
ncbi:MAG: hypothetical protein A2Y38_13985 [Spirochaetes bacterium GWB1_59_5]|nr:MAG: hypothetical protein A2Y38_13985 [Spirochaetes bacterium GWB1_59_5]